MSAAQIPLDLDWLTAVHSDKGLHLVTTDRSGFIYLAQLNAADETLAATAEAGFAYVTELVRLARLGQRVEFAAASSVVKGKGRPLTQQ